jgi:DNA (cytosine-5)-methyltransferase 1
MITAVDLFCGAGGTSSGILKAALDRLQLSIQLVAVNHWKTAINTHSLNHKSIQHICEPVENLHPIEVMNRIFGAPFCAC